MINVPRYVKDILCDFRFEQLDLNRQASYAYKQNKGSYGYMFHVAPRRKRHFLSRSTHNLFDQFLKWAEKNGAEAQLLKVYEDPENRKGYNLYTVMTDDGEEREIEAYEVQENDYHGLDLPMWSTMWLLERNYWKNHVKELSEAGFKVYDLKDENNLLVGIDGAGYNFMEAHFEPLYDSLGYRWHLANENTVSVQKAVALAVELGGKPDQIAKKLDLPKDTVMKYVPQKTR